jgi:hypothetical protein
MTTRTHQTERPGDRAPYFKNYRLYPHEVFEIRIIAESTDVSLAELAEQYGISRSHTGNIIRYRFWPEVS